MITFNNIPKDTRTPGAYIEIDNSRALTGLVQNPHKVLIIGQKLSTGSIPVETLVAISKDGLSNGYFGNGAVLARMCNTFKAINPNTELMAIALSNAGGVQAENVFKLEESFSATAETNLFLMVNGVDIPTAITSAWSVDDINSAILAKVNVLSTLPCIASTSGSAAGSDHVVFVAVQSGTLGNYIDIRLNYNAGESNPAGWSANGITITSMAGGSVDPSLADVWGIIDGEQYHYIIQPYIDSTNLGEVEVELRDRFKPLEDLQGHGFTSVRATLASCTTLGNSRNSPHNTIHGIYDSPTCPEEIAAALGAQAAGNLNEDPARPLHYLTLDGVKAPPISSRFNKTERNILLYDGIATTIVDRVGNVQIERCITTYQTDSTGLADPSYLDVQTLATLGEIRYQYKLRMVQRFVVPRFKLADDTFPIQPGMKVVQPKTIRQETIALFTLLRNQGLIENLEAFITNLKVERDATDRNRVNVLLPPDLINQFRILAGVVQFIL